MVGSLSISLETTMQILEKKYVVRKWGVSVVERRMTFGGRRVSWLRFVGGRRRTLLAHTLTHTLSLSQNALQGLRALQEGRGRQVVALENARYFLIGLARV